MIHSHAGHFGEIAERGGDSRFRKVDRGKLTLGKQHAPHLAISGAPVPAGWAIWVQD